MLEIRNQFRAHFTMSTAHCPLPHFPHPKHVVLTGGEPMLFAELIPLSTALHNAGWHITVETSGTLYLPVICDLMSISPKLSNSTPVQVPRPIFPPKAECPACPAVQCTCRRIATPAGRRGTNPTGTART